MRRKPLRFRWRQALPTRQQLLGWAPYAAIAGGLLACLALAILVLMPAWHTVETRAVAYAAIRQERDDRQLSVELMEQKLQDELATTIEAAAERTDLLLSRQEAGEILSRLYREAEVLGVQVTELRGQPSPQEVGEPPYQVRVLRLRANGDLRALLTLVARVQDLPHARGLLLENLVAEQESQEGALVADLVLFVAQELADAADDGSAGVLESQPLPGDSQAIAPPVEPEVDATDSAEQDPLRGPCLHHVAPGDTLYSMATRYGTTVMTLKTVNALVGDTIYAGQTLRIPAPD